MKWVKLVVACTTFLSCVNSTDDISATQESSLLGSSQLGDYGEVVINTKKVVTFIIKNNNTKASAIQFSALNPPWSYETNTCTATLGANKTCAVSVAFQPVIQNLSMATIQVTYKTGIFSKLLSIPIKGKGLPLPVPTTPDFDKTKPYLGMSLPADFKVFSPDSPWNLPISQNPPIHADSSSIVTNLIASRYRLEPNAAAWTSPLHVINSDLVPLQSVKIRRDNGDTIFAPSVDPDKNGVVEFPIPPEAWADPQEDAHMILVDPFKRKAWELGATLKDKTGWTARRAEVWDLNGLGYQLPFAIDYWWMVGVRGSGTPFIGGLIRIEEITAGVINHALAISTPINRKSSTIYKPEKREVCTPVAAWTDGHGIGKQFVPEGARFQLNPYLNLDALSLSKEAKIIAKALQVYGAYVVDNAQGIPIYFQNLGADGGAWNKFPGIRDINKIPLQELRVLDCTLVLSK